MSIAEDQEIDAQEQAASRANVLLDFHYQFTVGAAVLKLLLNCDGSLRWRIASEDVGIGHHLTRLERRSMKVLVSERRRQSVLYTLRL